MENIIDHHKQTEKNVMISENLEKRDIPALRVLVSSLFYNNGMTYAQVFDFFNQYLSFSQEDFDSIMSEINIS